MLSCLVNPQFRKCLLSKFKFFYNSKRLLTTVKNLLKFIYNIVPTANVGKKLWFSVFQKVY